MTTFEMLFFAGAVAGLLFMGLIASGRTGMGSWTVAALLSAGFLAFSLIPIVKEGPIGFVANHITNFWGVQVWYDLVFAINAAIFLAAPRARRVGMHLGVWLIPVLLLGSIGLFALLARLFWLEENSPTHA